MNASSTSISQPVSLGLGGLNLGQPFRGARRRGAWLAGNADSETTPRGSLANNSFVLDEGLTGGLPPIYSAGGSLSGGLTDRSMLTDAGLGDGGDQRGGKVPPHAERHNTFLIQSKMKVRTGDSASLCDPLTNELSSPMMSEIGSESMQGADTAGSPAAMPTTLGPCVTRVLFAAGAMPSRDVGEAVAQVLNDSILTDDNNFEPSGQPHDLNPEVNIFVPPLDVSTRKLTEDQRQAVLKSRYVALLSPPPATPIAKDPDTSVGSLDESWASSPKVDATSRANSVSGRYPQISAPPTLVGEEYIVTVTYPLIPQGSIKHVYEAWVAQTAPSVPQKEAIIRSLMYAVVSKVGLLHQQGRFHGSLKTTNIFCATHVIQAIQDFFAPLFKSTTAQSASRINSGMSAAVASRQSQSQSDETEAPTGESSTAPVRETEDSLATVASILNDMQSDDAGEEDDGSAPKSPLSVAPPPLGPPMVAGLRPELSAFVDPASNFTLPDPPTDWHSCVFLTDGRYHEMEQLMYSAAQLGSASPALGQSVSNMETGRSSSVESSGIVNVLPTSSAGASPLKGELTRIMHHQALAASPGHDSIGREEEELIELSIFANTAYDYIPPPESVDVTKAMPKVVAEDFETASEERADDGKPVALDESALGPVELEKTAPPGAESPLAPGEAAATTEGGEATPPATAEPAPAAADDTQPPIKVPRRKFAVHEKPPTGKDLPRVQSRSIALRDACRSIASREADIWNLGLIAIELADGEFPMWLWRQSRPTPNLRRLVWSKNFQQFVHSCTQADPSMRPSCTELRECSWFLHAGRGMTGATQVTLDEQQPASLASTLNRVGSTVSEHSSLSASDKGNMPPAIHVDPAPQPQQQPSLASVITKTYARSRLDIKVTADHIAAQAQESTEYNNNAAIAEEVTRDLDPKPQPKEVPNPDGDEDPDNIDNDEDAKNFIPHGSAIATQLVAIIYDLIDSTPNELRGGSPSQSPSIGVEQATMPTTPADHSCSLPRGTAPPTSGRTTGRDSISDGLLNVDSSRTETEASPSTGLSPPTDMLGPTQDLSEHLEPPMGGDLGGEMHPARPRQSRPKRPHEALENLADAILQLDSTDPHTTEIFVTLLLKQLGQNPEMSDIVESLQLQKITTPAAMLQPDGSGIATPTAAASPVATRPPVPPIDNGPPPAQFADHLYCKWRTISGETLRLHRHRLNEQHVSQAQHITSGAPLR